MMAEQEIQEPASYSADRLRTGGGEMSIMGIVYYDKYSHDHQMPEWARAERYEFCDGFYEADRKGGLLHSVASILMSIF